MPSSPSVLRDRGLEPRQVARFLDRMVFAFFAEDVGLLAEGLVSRLLDRTRTEPERFGRLIGQLFDAMAAGGDFGLDTIRRFNGNLFDSDEVLDLTRRRSRRSHRAAKLDWGAVDPSIFGTLFERGMDPDKRSQLGAHYTSREDIETLVEPVVMTPLRRQWDEARQLVDNLLATGKTTPQREREAAHRPGRRQGAGGGRSGGAPLPRTSPRQGARSRLRLRQLPLRHPAEAQGPGEGGDHLRAGSPRRLFLPLVGPWQLYGIEINPYAHELAQMTVWIGYLQWVRNNGFGVTEDPILRPMDNIQCKDAILDLTDPENPREPEWPKVDFIVGNPPFLAGSSCVASWEMRTSIASSSYGAIGCPGSRSLLLLV